MNESLFFKKEAILNGKNYNKWYDSLKDVLEKDGLGEYLIKDVVKEKEKATNSNADDIENAKRNNTKVRYIIKNTIGTKIYEDIIGMTTPREIIEYLEGEYKLNENDMTQWMNKLREVKAKKEEDIPFTLKRLFKLFKGMESSGNNISEKEKVKYILKSLPTCYKKKITLNSNETAENLRTTIVNDINT